LLSDRRLLLANARPWKPDLEIIEDLTGMTVNGWQDGRTATLVLEHDGGQVVIDQIRDANLAQELAAVIRTRAG
jgi:hypothetical protein